MNPSFWQGKRVFLTGHTGFKGGWLSLWLRESGAEVTGYAVPPNTQPNLFDSANINNSIHSIIGDVRDFQALQAALLNAHPQIIFHLAAQPLVRASYAAPLETYTTNVMGTAHVLEAARQCRRVRVIIIVTSDKCYDNREWIWGYRENDPLGGHDPYSSSKACAELVTQAYQRCFFHADKHPVGIASARAGNVIGGGDWAEDRLIPDFVSAVMAQKPLVLRNPLAIRPWQHVLEPLGGYLKLAEKLWQEPQKHSGAWNFGPQENDARTVQWVIEYMSQLWPEALPWQLDEHAQPHETQLLKLDCSKARFHLDWKPKWPLEKALQHTAAWYQTFIGQEKTMKTVCLEQIRNYTL